MSLQKDIVSIVALPRSGSTFTRLLIKQILFDYQDLGEFFNTTSPQYKCALDGRLVNVQSEKGGFKSGPGENADRNQKVIWENEQFEQLLNAKGKYVLKVNPFYEKFESVVGISRPIFVRRRNLFENFLSFALSSLTGRWYEPDGLEFGDKKFEVSYELFVSFCQAFVKIEAVREAAPDAPVFYFEDILDSQKIELFGQEYQLGDLDLSILPRKQNQKNKKINITNINEIEDWYKASPLETFWKLADNDLSKNGVRF